MPIFDDIHGFVPLPKSKLDRVKSFPGIGNINNLDNSTLNPIVPVSLPSSLSVGIDTSNTIVDQVFTKVNDVFNYIHLPTPEAIKDVYKNIQEIEGVISDPLSASRKFVEGTIYDIFNPKREYTGGNLPKDDNNYEKIRGSRVYKRDSSEGVKAEGSNPEYQWDKAKSSEDTFMYQQGEDEGKSIEFEFNGRKSIENTTLRLNHLWDIKLEPFHYGIDGSNIYVPDFNMEENILINKSPYYTNSLALKTDVYNKVPDYIPIMSYDMELKSLANKEIDLFSGSSIAIPEVIRYTSHLSMQIVEDENKRWRRWFQKYIENLYNEEEATVIPYKNSCMKLTLYQYRADYKVLSKNILLINLKNYQIVSEGAGNASPDLIDTQWSIVGAIDLDTNEKHLNII